MMNRPWARTFKETWFRRGETQAKHLSFPFIKDRWEQNAFQNKDQIDQRFLHAMEEMKIWFDAPTESEYWRLMELHIANGKRKQAKRIMEEQKQKQIEKTRLDIQQKKWRDDFGWNFEEVKEDE